MNNQSEINSKKGKVIRVAPVNNQDYGYRFVPNDDSKAQLRLTQIRMNVAQTPLGAPNEIDLNPFEGKEIIVQGHFGDDIVYDASIVENDNTSQYSD